MFLSVMKKLSLLLLLSMLSSFCKAQQLIFKDSSSHHLIERQKLLNAQKMTMPGYRVQLYFGAERVKANELRVDFLHEFPNVGAYVVYHQPNFKLRVGDFKTRIEAIKFLGEIKDRYSMAFIVSDDVKLPIIE